MKSLNDIVTTGAIGIDFLHRNCSYLETYHRLRVKGFGKNFALELLRKWINDRKTLETVSGKGKE